jgi:hypothetical protein
LFLTRLRSFSRLAGEEQRLALRALAWIAVVRICLALFKFTRVRALVSGSRRDDGTPGSARAAEWPAMVRRAVLRASRSLPGTTCLAQSLVAERLLRAGGCDARLSIGVAHAMAGGAAGAARKSIDAHAWVESGGLLVTGDDTHERYEVLATYGGE